eukprot:931347-Amphidinium_carterae.1
MHLSKKGATTSPNCCLHTWHAEISSRPLAKIFPVQQEKRLEPRSNKLGQQSIADSKVTNCGSSSFEETA